MQYVVIWSTEGRAQTHKGRSLVCHRMPTQKYMSNCTAENCANVSYAVMMRADNDVYGLPYQQLIIVLYITRGHPGGGGKQYPVSMTLITCNVT